MADIAQMDSPQQLTIPMGIPTIYFNGIGVGIGAVDISVVLNHNQMPITELKIPYPVAKTLAKALAGSIENYERMTGQTVVGAQELGQKFESASSAAVLNAAKGKV
jgi:hypothetical protein